MQARQPEGKLDCHAAFQRVKDQGRKPQAFTGAGNIGGADVSAAGRADIEAAKNAHQQIAEGNRTQQVGDHHDNEQKFRQDYVQAARLFQQIARQLGVPRARRGQLAFVEKELARGHCTELQLSKRF